MAKDYRKYAEIAGGLRNGSAKSSVSLAPLSTSTRWGVVTDLKASQIELMAEALGVCPEYLVCWTDDPTIARNTASNIHNSAVVQGNSATTLIVKNGHSVERELSEEEVELLRIFEALDVKGRTALLSAAFDLEEKIPVRPDDEEV